MKTKAFSLAPSSLQVLLTSTAAATLLLTACAANVKPDGANGVRQQLTDLQADPKLATRAPVAMQEAEQAVRAAETPTSDKAAGEQAVYVAQRKIEIARAQAERQLADEEVKNLGDQRNQIRLDARTREAEIAKAQADVAAAAAMQQSRIASAALQQNEELRRQMEDLQAKATDRGMVMTLGDVLFATGKADLKPGATDRLSKLAMFMSKYPDRSVVIEGHTDSTGSTATNEALSQRRADAVKAYLISQSIDAARVTAIGKGEESPVADNGTAAGRQQNRRVEIIISNPVTK